LTLDRAKGRGKDGGAKRFRTDPTLQVLLLHGFAQSAWLLVPFVHPSLGREIMPA
jgi:E3 ubiquitin-protein ligase SHPRH